MFQDSGPNLEKFRYNSTFNQYWVTPQISVIVNLPVPVD